MSTRGYSSGPACEPTATASTLSPSHARMSSCQGEKQNKIYILNNDADVDIKDEVDIAE